MSSKDSEEDYDDEDYDPLENGIDSVSWLPSLSENMSSSSPFIETGPAIKSSLPKPANGETEILPFFPLGGIVYTPNSEHVLNIFEPRYRQMYTDILMNGSKRFVVSMSHPNKDGTFATTGVIFYLEDLKEVSELTDDQVKYICNHKVTNRVQLLNVINPEAWRTRDTYLKVEACILYEDEDGNTVSDKSLSAAAVDNETDNEVEDDDEEDNDDEKEVKKDEKSDVYQTLMDAIKPKKSTPASSTTSSIEKKRKSPEEMILIASFQNLVDKQHEAEEDVRFTKSSIDSLAVAPGGDEDGLWQTVRLWQSFIDQRLVARQNEMQREFQEKLLEFLKKEKGIDEKELPSAIGFNDLTPALQQEVQDLQKRMNVELQPLVLESTLTIQKILEAKDHKARCLLLKYFMDAEKKRLDAKSTLQGMFAGNSFAVTEEESDGQNDLGDASDNVSDKGSDGSSSSSSSAKTSSASTSSRKNLDNLPPPPPPSSSQGALLVDEPDAFQ